MYFKVNYSFPVFFKCGKYQVFAPAVRIIMHDYEENTVVCEFEPFEKTFMCKR
jgi:hypothetical protein